MVDNDALRRAAILIGTLDVDSADALLERLPKDASARVRELMVELVEIDAEEEQRVIAGFLGRPGPEVDQLAIVADDGVELCLSTSLAQPTNSDWPADEPRGAQSSTTVSILSDFHPDNCKPLAALLAAERPQTIAVVLARLSKPRALEVLAALSTEAQAEVLERLVDLGEADPSIIAEIEEELERRIAGPSPGHAETAAHRAHVTEIVAAAAPTGQPPTIGRSSKVAEALHPKVEFEDLAYLNDAGLTSLLRAADPQVMVLALAGASESFVDRVTEQLPTGEAKKLRRAIESLGPLRLSDVDAAQRQITQIAADLGSHSNSSLAYVPQDNAS